MTAITRWAEKEPGRAFFGARESQSRREEAGEKRKAMTQILIRPSVILSFLLSRSW
jgi:hypothetical protein